MLAEIATTLVASVIIWALVLGMSWLLWWLLIDDDKGE